MKRTSATLVYLAFFTAATLAAASGVRAQEVFQYKHRVGQRLRVEGYVDESIYRNNVLVKSVRFRNTGNLTVSRVSGDRAFHEGSFVTYRSDTIPDDFVLEREYPTEFYRDKYGNYEIADVYFMPVVRGVPTFPVNPLEVGDQWRSKAHEAHDFRDAYGIGKPVLFPASVSYQYLGNMTVNGEKVAKLSINYVINHTLTYQAEMSADVPLPYRVVGYFNQLFFWNLDRGLPHSYKENFDYVFIMSSGEIFEYTGSSSGSLTVSGGPGEDETQIETIKNRLKVNIPSVEVTQTEQGIVINIGEILFKFDSDDLTTEASGDLDNIVDVLKDFQDRNIRVIGHTDSVGPEDYNLNLSLRRARRTAVELKKRVPGFGDRITFIGLGESKPIADNGTEEGRKKNRRVEIIILKK
jgi:outer membrane protein OmpA-like peptidoglycan-associated protein